MLTIHAAAHLLEVVKRVAHFRKPPTASGASRSEYLTRAPALISRASMFSTEVVASEMSQV
jgi:hypothetical protein